MRLKLDIFRGGYCTHPEFVVIRGGSRKSVRFPALFALIHHPDRGLILFDTGYSPRFYDAAKRFPYRIYALITPVFATAADSAIEQLRGKGIEPADIKTIIVSHFHADHIAGLKDFPNAQFMFLPDAYEAVKGKRGLGALRAGFLPDLMPDDFAQRARPVGTQHAIRLPAAFSPLEQGYDLLLDGSLIGVPLPGHAPGQMGLWLKNATDDAIFLIADACWYSRAYRDLRFPNAIANLALADSKGYRQTLHQLHQLHQQQPSLHILPSHCPEVSTHYTGVRP